METSKDDDELVAASSASAENEPDVDLLDFPKAFHWFSKGAEQGHAEAQFYYAYCYDFGEGAAEDKKKAFYWYGKAAEQGDTAAQNNYGYFFEQGWGAEKDLEKAVYWYGKAAEQGYANALSHLGRHYRGGTGGLAQDYAKAEELFNKAIAGGYNGAEAELEKLKEMREK